MNTLCHVVRMGRCPHASARGTVDAHRFRTPTKGDLVSLSADQSTGGSATGTPEPTESNLPGGRYLLVLICLITSYLISALMSGRVAIIIAALFYLATILLALSTSRHPEHRLARGVPLGIGTAAAIGLVAAGTDVTTGIASLWFVLILAITVGVVVRRVLLDPVVTLQTIFGALSAYLMIGLMFAAGYAAIKHLSTESLFVNGEPANTKTIQYFSFTTLTTLGYGDFTAAGNAGRAIATLEALAGQIFLATLVARLVASYVPMERSRK